MLKYKIYIWVLGGRTRDKGGEVIPLGGAGMWRGVGWALAKGQRVKDVAGRQACTRAGQFKSMEKLMIKEYSATPPSLVAVTSPLSQPL